MKQGELTEVKDMQQKWIQVGEEVVPVVIEKGTTKYYPLSYIENKILKRSGSLTAKGKREKYKDKLNRFTIKFDISNTQECLCVTEDTLKEIITSLRKAYLTDEQIEAENNLRVHLNLPNIKQNIISSEDFVADDNLYDSYDKSLILRDIENETDTLFLCQKCERHYPMIKRYFATDSRRK